MAKAQKPQKTRPATSEPLPYISPRTTPVIVAVVLLLSVEDRRKFQKQAEKQISYQTHPVALIRQAVSDDRVKAAEEAAKAAGAQKVFVMDGTRYYARDFIETSLLGFDGRYVTSWTFEKKAAPEKLKEILRTEYDFFKSAYGL